MRRVFADAGYWIALAYPKDQLHAKAVEVSKTLGSAHLFTTDEVLNEFLNFYCAHGKVMRETAVKFVEEIDANPNTTVVPQTRESFTRGLRFYRMRLDKAYSMADCVSMETMRDRNINDVLTNDHHFAQEKFHILL